MYAERLQASGHAVRTASRRLRAARARRVARAGRAVRRARVWRRGKHVEDAAQRAQHAHVLRRCVALLQRLLKTHMRMCYTQAYAQIELALSHPPHHSPCPTAAQKFAPSSSSNCKHHHAAHHAAGGGGACPCKQRPT